MSETQESTQVTESMLDEIKEVAKVLIKSASSPAMIVLGSAKLHDALRAFSYEDQLAIMGSNFLVALEIAARAELQAG